MTAPNDEPAVSFAGLTGAYWLDGPAPHAAVCPTCRRMTHDDTAPRPAAACLRLMMLGIALLTIAAGFVRAAGG